MQTVQTSKLQEVIEIAKPHLAGTNNGRAKLTEKLVLEIRAAEGTHRAIAAKYGISANQVGSIRRLESWAHIQADSSEANE